MRAHRSFLRSGRLWALRAAGAVATVVAATTALVGCAAQVEADDWTLEPIAFDTALLPHPGIPAQPSSGGQRDVDLAYGMSTLSGDGAGGFWAVSGGSWLHIDDEGRTAARFDVDSGHPLSRVDGMAALSADELVVVIGGADPQLAVLETSTMRMREIPAPEPAALDDLDLEFADVAVDGGEAIAVRYRPSPPDYVAFEVLRIDLDDGSRTPVYTAPLSVTDAPESGPGFPPVDVDVDASGRIHLATPTSRMVLSGDGVEQSATRWRAEWPLVAVAPDSTALWWGGTAESTDPHAVITGGSAEARASIEERMTCDSVRRSDGLHVSSGDLDDPLPFLCGANAAIWTGESWVASIGGEGDGVLVRVTAPAAGIGATG